jgi:NAD(P)-dependent dehydrogenase (short-subunit alcohol dehydrogenase family)
MSYLEEQFGLKGRRALVTGAGRGIGRAIAEALSGAGAEVCVHYNKSESAANEVVTLLESRGGKAFAAGADLTDSAQVKTLFEKIQSRWNSLDILVNNAGDLVKRSTVEDFADDVLDYVVKLNFHSAVYVTRSAIPMLRRGKDPSIINLSSVAAHHGANNGATIYAATKAAIHTYTRGLAKELAPDIRVNAIAPGVALTDFHKTHSSSEALAAVRNSTPLGRLGIAEDHGAAVVFLCAKGAAFITGEVIEINGGLWVA